VCTVGACSMGLMYSVLAAGRQHTWYFFQNLLSFFVFSAASSAKLLNL
jgi:hypothetical protein